MKIIEINPSMKELVDDNGGYCPCAIERREDTKCPCKDFTGQEEGDCLCGRYRKVKE